MVDEIFLDKYAKIIGETPINAPTTAEQEYEKIVEIAKGDVLDKAVIEFASRFNNLSDFDAFFNELLPLADFQRKKTDFRNIMSRIRKNIEKQQQSEKQPFTIEVLQQFLNEHNIVIRENVITHEIEADNLPKEYCFDGSAAHLGTILYSELRKNGLAVAQNVVENYIMVIARQHSYNPVAEILKNKVWDGKDRFGDLFEIMHISNPFQKKLIGKWLLTVSLYNSEKEPISAEGVLVLVGEQAIGKTSLVRKLGINNRLCKTGLSLDCKNKDSVITAVSCFIGELGELESTFKSDIQALKAFFTQEFDTLRKPYGRSFEKVTRRSTYVATCNSKEFLIDESGNRRYWTIWTIDCEQRFELEKLQKLDEIQLWLQVYDLIQKHGKQAFRLSPEEIKELNTHNEKHEKKLKGQQEIEDILSKESDDNYKIEYALMTTTDFKNEWDRELKAYSASVIGKVLDKLGYEVETVKRNGKTAKLRRLPKQLCYPTNQK